MNGCVGWMTLVVQAGVLPPLLLVPAETLGASCCPGWTRHRRSSRNTSSTSKRERRRDQHGAHQSSPLTTVQYGWHKDER